MSTNLDSPPAIKPEPLEISDTGYTTVASMSIKKIDPECDNARTESMRPGSVEVESKSTEVDFPPHPGDERDDSDFQVKMKPHPPKKSKTINKKKNGSGMRKIKNKAIAIQTGDGIKITIKKQRTLKKVNREVEFDREGKVVVARKRGRRRNGGEELPRKRMGRPPKRIEHEMRGIIANDASNLGNIKCKFCQLELCGLGELRLHVMVKHKNDPGFGSYIDDLGGYIYEGAGECKYCGKLFTTMTDLRKHARSEHYSETDFGHYIKDIGGKVHTKTGQNFKCNLCPAQTVRGYDLYKHAVDRHQHTAQGQAYINQLMLDVTITCHQCGKTFLDKKQHYQHMRNVHPEQLFSCDTCGNTFKTPMSLRHHIATLHSDKERSRVMCHLCPRSFISVYKLRTHIRERHGSVDERKCPICNKIINTFQALRRHVESFHQKMRSVLCQYCGKGFYNARDCLQHVKIVHENVSEECKPYTCEFCHKKFASFANFNKHVKTVHLKQFSFNCKICDKGFAQGKPFREHVVRHHPELEGKIQDKSIKTIEPSDMGVTSSSLKFREHALSKEYNKGLEKDGSLAAYCQQEDQWHPNPAPV